MDSARIVLAAIVAAVLATSAAGTLGAQANATPTPPLELDITSSTRLLVIAPHPDDEALGAASTGHC